MTSPSDLRHETVKPLRVLSADPGFDTTADRPHTRVVLLGASNLTLAFPTVISWLHSGLGAPLNVYAAHGHGRSFGSWSRVVVRALPGIAACPLWHSLQSVSIARQNDMRAQPAGIAVPQGRTFGLLTDIGNDLLYGATVPQISGWVETCLERLRSCNADVTMTLLPMQSVERLSALRYHMTKALFFPGRNLGWNEMLGRARALNARIAGLGREYGARIVEPLGEWYSFDPIHIRRGCRDVAWQQILSEWPGFDADAPPTHISLAARCRLRLQAPAERRLFGVHRTKKQPASRFEQIAIHLY